MWHSKYTSSPSLMSLAFRLGPIFRLTAGASAEGGIVGFTYSTLAIKYSARTYNGPPAATCLRCCSPQ